MRIEQGTHGVVLSFSIADLSRSIGEYDTSPPARLLIPPACRLFIEAREAGIEAPSTLRAVLRMATTLNTYMTTLLV